MSRFACARWLTLVTALLLAGCNQPSTSRAYRIVFGGAGAAAAVRNATTVRAYRMKSPSYFAKTIDKYEMVGDPVAVPGDMAAQLKKALLNPRSYIFDAVKSCEPDYGVRLEFVHNNRKVDVLLCFECRILTVYDGGRNVGGEDFDPINDQLIGMVKKLFPKDEAIQALE